jgi:hypothetical protein
VTTSETPTCAVCGDPIDLGARFVAIIQQTEISHFRETYVIDADVIARYHELCKRDSDAFGAAMRMFRERTAR